MVTFVAQSVRRRSRIDYDVEHVLFLIDSECNWRPLESLSTKAVAAWRQEEEQLSVVTTV